MGGHIEERVGGATTTERRRKMKDRGGFTLLELLMVVIIIAILAAIALPQYIRATEKARAAEAIQILGAVRTSEIRFKAQSATNDYTGVLTDLDVTYTGFGAWGAPVISVTAAAAPAGSTGMAVMARAAGQFAGQTIGIQFTSGTICGTFTPIQPPVLAACAQD